MPVTIRHSSPDPGKPTAPEMPPISDRERAILTEAVHRAVCEITGTDGYAKCLLYAVAGYALLADRGFAIQAGTVAIVADPDNPAGPGTTLIEAAEGGWNRGEYHCWLARPTDPVEMVDFSSRHFRRHTEEASEAAKAGTPAPVALSITGLAEARADSIEWLRGEPPDSLWVTAGKAVGRPLAHYHALAETTRLVQQVLLQERETTRENVVISRKHYRALGGTIASGQTDPASL